MAIATAQPRSGNEKLGQAAATYVAQVSCPTDCVFRDGGGCYAETGRLGKFHTERLNANAAGASALEAALAEAEAIDGLPFPECRGRPLRLHVVGDCASDEAARIVSAAAASYVERGGGAVWTYTHAWRSVERRSWGAVSVLASCESEADVQAARARGYAPSLVVDAFQSEMRYADDGLELLPCPAQTSHRTCSDCGLCFNDSGLLERGVVVAFALHGTPLTLKRARKALRDPSDPARRLTAEQLIRGALAENPLLTRDEAAVAAETAPRYAQQLLDFIQGRAEHPSVLRSRRAAAQRPRAA